MKKHKDGRNDSESLGIKVKSRSSATAEDLLDYMQPLARKKQKNNSYTYKNKRFTEWFKYHQEDEKSDKEHSWNWGQPRNSNYFFSCY